MHTWSVHQFDYLVILYKIHVRMNLLLSLSSICARRSELSRICFILSSEHTVSHSCTVNRMEMGISLFHRYHLTVSSNYQLWCCSFTQWLLWCHRNYGLFQFACYIVYTVLLFHTSAHKQAKFPFRVLFFLFLFFSLFVFSFTCLNGMNIKLIFTYYDWRCFQATAWCWRCYCCFVFN